MNKDQFTSLVNSQIQDAETASKPQAQVLATAYLDQVSGAYGPGFINGYFSSFSQSQPGGGGPRFGEVYVPIDDGQKEL